MQTEDKRHTIEVLRSATVEGHHRLRPANQFHHLATVHMLSGERNGQQAQRALDNEQRQDQDIRSGSGASGVLCLIGGVLLLKRRLFSPRVRATTTGADILILSLLVIQCALGLLTIPFSAQHMDGSEMMKLVGWAQSVVTFHGGASQHLDGVAFIFRLHLVLGMTLFLLFPFSRLVHIWSVPVEYLTRKYQLVRARH